MATKKPAAKQAAPKKAAAKKAKPKKAVTKKAPVKKATPKKAVKKPAKTSRYCLGKCHCGGGCCLNSGHSGAHGCITHAKGKK